MPTTHMPITITVRCGELDLFDVDCEAHVEYDAPEGQDAPDWDVLWLFFEGPGKPPEIGKRVITRVGRPDPIFNLLYEHLPHEYIATKLSEMLEDE